MAGKYITTRERTLLGAAGYQATRKRTLLGRAYRSTLGDDSTDIDPVTGLPCDDPRANCTPDISIAPPPPSPIFTSSAQPAPPQLPPSFFQPVRPILPTPKPINVGPAPVLTSPPPPAIVFPSFGPITVAPSGTPAPTSWLDQQMIAGVSNKYLALGVIGAVFFVSMASAKRRR